MEERPRTQRGKFRKQYKREDLTAYLKGIHHALRRSPVYRDLKAIPGPSPTTIIRHFGSWSKALKTAGIRPHTNQLTKEEKKFIKTSWRSMTDKQISSKLQVPTHVIRYYRLYQRLWKNSRDGNAQGVQRRKAYGIYGKTCEVCSIPIVDLNHIISRKNFPENWTILCPLCHATLTRNLVKITTRRELKTKLLPFMKELHKKHFKFRE